MKERGIAVPCGAGEGGALRDGDGCVPYVEEGEVVEIYVANI